MLSQDHPAPLALLPPPGFILLLIIFTHHTHLPIFSSHDHHRSPPPPRYGVIFDHVNLTVYWRTRQNQNLQRLRLADAMLARGSTAGHLNFTRNDLPWYNDAADAVKR
jgi:hypothetical protein